MGKKEEKEVVDTTEKVEKTTKESDAKKAFRAVIEAYKVKNPAKYEEKKVALEEQLNSME